MFDLTGKTALVTGASGASAGHCALVAWAGAAVALSGTRREALEALAENWPRGPCAALRP